MRHSIQVTRMTREKVVADRDLVEFGGRFSVARKRAGVTQQALARAVGVDQSQVSRLERGERGLETVTFLRLLRIAANHGISVDGCLVVPGNTFHDKVLIAVPASVARKLEQVINTNLLPPAESRDPSDKPKRAGKRRHK